MTETLRDVLGGVVDRLQYHVAQHLPSLLAALILVAAALVAATVVRWLLYRIFKGLAIDRFLRQSGVASLVSGSGHLRATQLVAESSWWAILLVGVLMGLSVFNTDLTSQMVQAFVFLLPKLAVAGLILLTGAWLAQYLSRGTLLWAVEENLPGPRRLAALVKVLVFFVAVVVAADQMNFARGVFLAAFIILVGGAALAASLAIGLSGGRGLARFFEEKPEERDDRSLWTHL